MVMVRHVFRNRFNNAAVSVVGDYTAGASRCCLDHVEQGNHQLLNIIASLARYRFGVVIERCGVLIIGHGKPPVC